MFRVKQVHTQVTQHTSSRTVVLKMGCGDPKSAHTTVSVQSQNKYFCSSGVCFKMLSSAVCGLIYVNMGLLMFVESFALINMALLWNWRDVIAACKLKGNQWVQWFKIKSKGLSLRCFFLFYVSICCRDLKVSERVASDTESDWSSSSSYLNLTVASRLASWRQCVVAFVVFMEVNIPQVNIK